MVFVLLISISYAQDKPGESSDEKPAESAVSDAVSTAELNLDQVIEKLQENYGKIDTYQAEFKQQLSSTVQGKVISKGSGTVFYKKPGKMLWRYTAPEDHIFLTDGNTIWDYSPVDKEAYVLPVSDRVYKSFLLGLGDIRKDFEVSFHSGRKKNKDGQYQLDLVPRSQVERETLGTITLYVDPESFMVKSTEMVDAFGNRNVMRFSDMELNVPLDDSVFKFEPPPGTQVIRSEELEAIKPDK